MGRAIILWKWLGNYFSHPLDANIKIEDSVAHAKKIGLTPEVFRRGKYDDKTES
jgi:hypothetical protein